MEKLLSEREGTIMELWQNKTGMEFKLKLLTNEFIPR
jgi:hypothetical protein